MRKSRGTVVSKSALRIRAIRPDSWEKDRLREILRRLMRGKRVLVVGDVGVDRYTAGRVERISPEAPVPIVLVENELLKLGLAANVADNVQALGGNPSLLGIVGADRIAQDFRRLLRSVGIPGGHLVEDPGRRTVLKERIVSESQQLLRIDYETAGPLSEGVDQALLRRFRQLLSKCDFVILEDYHKGLLNAERAREIFAEARKSGRKVAVDPNQRTPVEWYRGAYLLTPNTKEAERLSGIAIGDADSLAEAGRAILRATRAAHVVITRGRDGMAIFSAGSREIHLIPTYAREVYDVSGAGDTVISVLALALAAGASIEEASVLGNLAAGVEVGKRGTATVSPEEIEQALDFFGSTERPEGNG